MPNILVLFFLEESSKLDMQSYDNEESMIYRTLTELGIGHFYEDFSTILKEQFLGKNQSAEINDLILNTGDNVSLLMGNNMQN
ncbi:MAG: hypothetical protein PHS92_00465 [Candidatus Gracilibacteria bacterium]|nr:hypothetical protein [Candidatus Gracilibacteria bacterium]